jgi:hypothetical protein
MIENRVRSEYVVVLQWMRLVDNLMGFTVDIFRHAMIDILMFNTILTFGGGLARFWVKKNAALPRFTITLYGLFTHGQFFLNWLRT